MMYNWTVQSNPFRKVCMAKYVRREGQFSLHSERNSQVQRFEENHKAAEQDPHLVAAMFLPLIFLPISPLVLC